MEDVRSYFLKDFLNNRCLLHFFDCWATYWVEGWTEHVKTRQDNILHGRHSMLSWKIQVLLSLTMVNNDENQTSLISGLTAVTVLCPL